MENTNLPSVDEVFFEQNESTEQIIVCSVFEDQRPLKGTAGLLDWRLRGFLSKFFLTHRITGAQGEMVYIPVKHFGKTHHLMLVGLGSHAGPATKTQDTADQDSLLKKTAETLQKLGINRVKLSASSFPFWNESRVQKAFKGMEIQFFA